MKQQLSFFSSIGEEAIGPLEKHVTINEVFIDSRKKAKNSLFIPIIGERFDGHEFIEDAIRNGAVATYWQKDRLIPEHLTNKINFILVEDTLQALQSLSAHYLATVKPIVIAITGSNGKTTTKDLVASVLNDTYKTYKTQGNLNNHIGMPLTILSMDESCEVLILEMGMNNLGEISFLSQLAQPDYAIITNIGDSHLEQLESREKIAQAKMEIRDGLEAQGKMIIDGDEPLLASMQKDNQVISCGYGEHCDIQIMNVQGNEDGQSFQINSEHPSYYIKMLGKHNVKNALYAIAIAKKLKVKEKDIKTGLERLQLTGMRLERMRGKKGSLLINDAYNASPTSMIASLDTLSVLTEFPNKVAILGDMYELGAHEEALHRKVAQAINDNIQTVICIGEKGQWIGEALRDRRWNGSLYFCKTKEEAKTKIEKIISKDTAILFKASRGMQLETLLDTFVCRE